MTKFEKLKERVEAYDFGLLGDVKLFKHRIKGVNSLRVYVPVSEVETGKEGRVHWQTSVVGYAYTDAELQTLIEHAWTSLWRHEMKEHMTRNGTKVYHAH